MPSFRTQSTSVGYAAAVMALGVTALFFGWMSPTRALFINPTSPPPGGQASIPLNSSDTAQTKTGSLVLGGQALLCDLTTPLDPDSEGSNRNACANLCLNSSSVTRTDITKCISAWTDLRGIGNTSLLQLHTELTETTPPEPQTGYVYLTGAPNDPNPTLSISLPVLSPGGSIALKAEGNSIDNYAGYFNGDVKIEGATSSESGRLCLNGTGTREGNTDGYYCITAWDQLSSIITNKLTLQAPPPALSMTEYGHVGISKSFNSASVVLGDASTIPLEYQRDDGTCNSSSLVPETELNSPVDCADMSPPKSFLASIIPPSTSTVSISVTTDPVLPANTQIQILVVRSTVENFSFTPMDGVTYFTSATQYGPTLAVVATRNVQQVNSGERTETFTDTITGPPEPKYYYRAYQGNAFPRYGAASDVKTVTFSSTAPPAETVSLPIQVAP